MSQTLTRYKNSFVQFHEPAPACLKKAQQVGQKTAKCTKISFNNLCFSNRLTVETLNEYSITKFLFFRRC